MVAIAGCVSSHDHSHSMVGGIGLCQMTCTICSVAMMVIYEDSPEPILPNSNSNVAQPLAPILHERILVL